MNRQQAERRGRWAEWLGGFYLNLKGYRILARRLKTPLGEIDLLVRRGDVVAIVEVKQRADYLTAAYSITSRQQHRLMNAARFVLAQRPELSNHSVRFDALLVNRWGWPQHCQGAFTDATA